MKKFLKKGGWIIVAILGGILYLFFENAIELMWDNVFDIIFSKSEKLGVLFIILLLVIAYYVLYDSISKRCKIDPVYKAKIEKELRPLIIPCSFIVVVAIILLGTILFE